MKKYFAACNNMISASVRYIKVIEFLIVNLFFFLMVRLMDFSPEYKIIPWTLLIYIVIYVIGCIDSFIDYLCFAGISSRKGNHLMDMMRSSFKAGEFIGNSLVGDTIIRFIWEVICCAPIYTFILFQSEENIFAIKLLSLLSIVFLDSAAVNLMMVFTRRVGLTMQVHLTLSFSLSAFFAIIPEGLFVISYRSDSTVLAGIMLFMSVIFASVSAFILVKDSYKGFCSGYFDRKE